jgi:hypothetical protein
MVANSSLELLDSEPGPMVPRLVTTSMRLRPSGQVRRTTNPHWSHSEDPSHVSGHLDCTLPQCLSAVFRVAFVVNLGFCHGGHDLI